MPSFNVLITRDTTESTLVPVEAATAEEAEALALDAYRSLMSRPDALNLEPPTPVWEVDDAGGTPYICDPGNCAFPA